MCLTEPSSNEKSPQKRRRKQLAPESPPRQSAQISPFPEGAPEPATEVSHTFLRVDTTPAASHHSSACLAVLSVKLHSIQDNSYIVQDYCYCPDRFSCSYAYRQPVWDNFEPLCPCLCVFCGLHSFGSAGWSKRRTAHLQICSGLCPRLCAVWWNQACTDCTSVNTGGCRCHSQGRSPSHGKAANSQAHEQGCAGQGGRCQTWPSPSTETQLPSTRCPRPRHHHCLGAPSCGYRQTRSPLLD